MGEGTMIEKEVLKDVQASRDDRQLPIDMVGVKNVEWPIKLKDKFKVTQHTVGKFAMYVRLPKEQKGTHMSRFIEALAKFTDEDEFFSMDVLTDKIAPYVMEELESLSVHIECEFTYFVEMASPMTHGKSKLPVKCCFGVEVFKERKIRMLEVIIPVLTMCPCSLEMSKTPHNQRGYITIQVEPDGFMWIEELVMIAQNCCSVPTNPLLKRPDEKMVMDEASKRPMFVEDVVREVAILLKKDERVINFEVSCENHESIHPHNAFASIGWERNI